MTTNHGVPVRFPQGLVFINAPAADVQAHLAQRSITRFQVNPTRLRVDADGPQLVLTVLENPSRSFPMRRSCFDKLLRWHKIPDAPVARMGSETAVHLLTGVLGLIAKDVLVRIEDGDALTVTSTDYAELPDADVLAQCHGLHGAASRVTRTDHFLRVHYDNRLDIEPVVGDVCGLGVEINNSETGFMALQVSASVLRLVCKNGAVAPIRMFGTSMVHYDVPIAALHGALQDGFRKAEQSFSILSKLLSQSVRLPAVDLRSVTRRLDELLGPGRGKSMTERFREQPSSRTLYDLFNFVTRAAQDHDPTFRFRLESYAGELLAASGDGTPTPTHRPLSP